MRLDRRCQAEQCALVQLESGCRLVVPLCPKGNGSTNSFRLLCVKLGAFQITHVGAASSDTAPAPEDGSPCGEVTTNIVCGRFLGGATAVAGQGVAQRPDPNSIVVIKLVE